LGAKLEARPERKPFLVRDDEEYREEKGWMCERFRENYQ
jgi:hypothetical protein